MRDLERGLQLASRYTLVRKLGRGGATETWLATDRMTRASVALKIAVDSRADVDLLRREWQLALRLVHAHIVRVFEFHSDDDVAFYTQQYIDGADAGILAGLPPQEVLAPIALILDALVYAHGKRVVHRDIKQSNILIDANGSPYLIDFGVASAGADDVGGGSLIAASPGQLRGEAAVPADDIFALGGLIYELISGQSPYRSESTREDIASRTPPPLQAADGSELAPAIGDLVASMLDKDPSRRPDAATARQQLVDAGIEPGPVAPERIGRPRGAGDEIISTETVRRKAPAMTKPADAVVASGDGLNPRVVIGTLAVLLLLLVGVVFFLPDAVDRDTVTPPVATEEPAADNDAAAAPQTDTLPQRDERVQARASAEKVLGQLLAKIRTLEARAVPRWGGLAWKQADEAYKRGDAEYLERNYEAAERHYSEALKLVDPLLDQVDVVFRNTMRDAESAFDNAEVQEAVRLYDLAVAISPSHAGARAGLKRARGLDAVLALTEQALAHERDLELEAALASFERAIEIDPEWTVAVDGRKRLLATINQMQFDARMTEGLNALADRDYRAARAAFQRARELQPKSQEPLDGLRAVEQEIRLDNIAALERQGRAQQEGEQWQAAVDTYKQALELDGNLTFAHEGLARATRMTELHRQLDAYIDDPDSLSAPRTMQAATSRLLEITRMPEIGPRLASQRDELSRLLKRAATPLTVELVSDNATDVSIYKVGKLGTFERTELSLRPGTYVAVGSRPGFRDVRLEFRVAPEIDMQPIIVRCEEKI